MGRAHGRRMTVAAAASAEDQSAAVIDQLAEPRPGRAAHLRSVSESARRNAADKRRRVKKQLKPYSCARDHASTL